jgi:hypothetical protein
MALVSATPSDQPPDGVDADVEVVLDVVEVALVGVGDLGRDVALGDAVHVLGRHVQGLDDRVQHPIQAFDDGAVAALEQVGSGPLGEAALLQSGGYPENLLLQQIFLLRLLLIMYWKVQNGGADGRVSLGANAPAVTC